MNVVMRGNCAAFGCVISAMLPRSACYMIDVHCMLFLGHQLMLCLPATQACC
jgi:hypothetical protein